MCLGMRVRWWRKWIRMEIVLLIFSLVLVFLIISNIYYYNKLRLKKNIETNNVTIDKTNFILDNKADLFNNTELFEKGIEKGISIALKKLYWEYYIDYLSLNQRSFFRNNDRFLIVSFQLKSDSELIGSPVKLLNYLDSELEWPVRKIDKNNELYFGEDRINDIIKNKIEYMKLCSTIDIRFIKNNNHKYKIYESFIDGDNHSFNILNLNDF